jgi:hypothetical protein
LPFSLTYGFFEFLLLLLLPARVIIIESNSQHEMISYISGRYDTNAIFAATGSARLQIVVMMCLDIAVHHIYCIGNPVKLSDIRKEALRASS